MITLLQRVSEARVEVGGDIIGAIQQGLLVLVGVYPDDDAASARRSVERLLNYRVFSDADGKSVLVVPLGQLRATGRISHVELDG